MKKIIEDLVPEKGIKRVTTFDEGGYIFPSDDQHTGLPEYDFDPSDNMDCRAIPDGHSVL
jgi:hypothetical protein